MNLNIFKQGLLGITLGCLVSASFANTSNSGGISLGATRVIYPADAKQVSLSIMNSNNKERFLINAWIENTSEEKTKDFLITPPLFVAEAGAENTLRIINVAPNLPQDRESVFWINVKAIPSIDKSALADKNILQLAILSRIKLFVRPSGLTATPESALQNLKFSKSGESISVDNPSPYHVSFVNVYLDKEKLANVMAAPFSKTKISSTNGSNLSYQTVNDFGGLTPTVNLTLK